MTESKKGKTTTTKKKEKKNMAKGTAILTK